MKRKVLITFTSALLAFQNVVHSLTFIGSEMDLEIIANTVQKIGSKFESDIGRLGLVGCFKINNTKNIPVYLYTTTPDRLVDKVCIFSDSTEEDTINMLKRNKVCKGCVICKLSEIDAQLENIKMLLNKTLVRSEVLPNNQTPKTSIIKPVLSVGLVTAVTTIAARVFYDTKDKKAEKQRTTI